MDIVLHDTVQAYEAEYARVRSVLIAQGSSLNTYLKTRGICRQLAYRALKGRSLGRKAIALRTQIIRDVLDTAA
ncbi:MULTISPECIES: hypothetical protein [Methylobacterium]|uniref:hypothetical protein n=1 Tax=Methylobacterium TaxID=407 RepID=UPI0008DAE393|nr:MULTISPECIES: hypothetical protein [Methylobacterium]MDH3028650.1 hypothetical protein [Methylobacterium fujisawaense]